MKKLFKVNNQYFILRHGESLRQINGLIACWPEKFHCPLISKGEKQIKEVARKLKREKIDIIFSSDLLRTKQTAEIISEELGIKIVFDKRLREVGLGIFNGKPLKEARKFWDPEEKLSVTEYTLKRFQIAPLKGETYIEIEERMFEFMKEINKKHKGKNILIVSHQRPLTLLEKVIYGYDIKKFIKVVTEKKEIETGEVRKLKVK